MLDECLRLLFTLLAYAHQQPSKAYGMPNTVHLHPFIRSSADFNSLSHTTIAIITIFRLTRGQDDFQHL